MRFVIQRVSEASVKVSGGHRRDRKGLHGAYRRFG